MRRREFISLVGGASLALPLATRAQQGALPVIGFLGQAPASSYASRLEGLRAGLAEQGYVEGKTLAVEFRWADAPADAPKLAAELAAQKVAVIVCSGNAASRAAKAATSTISIVFSAADDPVKLGFVGSFNRPGGNMTGLSLISGALGGKRLELLRALVPGAKVIAVLTDPNNPAENLLRDDQAAASIMGQRILALNASTVPEIERAFAVVAEQQAGALLVTTDSLFTAERSRIVALAARHRVPAIYAWREFVDAGGLMIYGTNLSYAYRQMGVYVGRILKGETPADLPIMQPTKFELIVNAKAAKALGLAIPDRLLALADEVIE